MSIKESINALEQQSTGALGELSLIVNDMCTDNEINRLQRNVRVVHRTNDTSLKEEFV